MHVSWDGMVSDPGEITNPERRDGSQRQRPREMEREREALKGKPDKTIGNKAGDIKFPKITQAVSEKHRV